MNTFIHFVNRVRELEFLENQFTKPASFCVLYGRRRVGKSELIKKFISSKKAVYLLASQEVEKGVLESFSQKIAEFFGDATLKIRPFAEFSELMEYLMEKD